MVHRRLWNRNIGIALAIFVFVLAVGGAIEDSSSNQAQHLYKSQLGACERGNTLRIESNDRIADHVASNAVVHDFLIAARAARKASYERDHKELDRKAV